MSLIALSSLLFIGPAEDIANYYYKAYRKLKLTFSLLKMERILDDCSTGKGKLYGKTGKREVTI